KTTRSRIGNEPNRLEPLRTEPFYGANVACSGRWEVYGCGVSRKSLLIILHLADLLFYSFDNIDLGSVKNKDGGPVFPGQGVRYGIGNISVFKIGSGLIKLPFSVLEFLNPYKGMYRFA